MIKPKTRITSFSQTGVLPSGYQLLLHWPSANEKRQRDNENCYETTWMTPIKFKITRVPMTAATSGRKLIIVLYILFISCPLFVVNGPNRQSIPTVSWSFHIWPYCFGTLSSVATHGPLSEGGLLAYGPH